MYQQVARCDSGGSGAHRDDSIHLMWGYCGVLSTVDLYRVNFEVNNLKPFACLAFPQTTYLKTPRKQPFFGDELVTSFCRPTSPTGIFCKNDFGTWRGHATNAGYGLTGYEREYRTHCKPWRSITHCGEGEVCGLRVDRRHCKPCLWPATPVKGGTNCCVYTCNCSSGSRSWTGK